MHDMSGAEGSAVSARPTRVAILLFEGVDLLDVGGPYEVFLTANRLAARRGQNPPFEVVTTGPGAALLTAYGGLGLLPQVPSEELDSVDVLLVPGAIAIEEVAADQEVGTAVRQLAARAGIVGSICTGAFLLGDAGLLEGLDWTTHWEDIDELARRIGSERGQRNVPWVDAGKVVTAGGLSSGLSMAIHLVDRLAGRELATATARQLDYAWEPAAGRGP